METGSVDVLEVPAWPMTPHPELLAGALLAVRGVELDEVCAVD